MTNQLRLARGSRRAPGKRSPAAVRPSRTNGIPTVCLGVSLLVLVASLAFAQRTDLADRATLNPGLGPVPALVVRSSPAAAWRSFFALTASGDFAAAAHLLDLSDLPTEQQQALGPVLARRLMLILVHSGGVDSAQLSSNPAGTLQDGVQDNEERVADVSLQGRAVVIALARSSTAAQGHIWTFSRETVANIDELYASKGYGWIGDHLPAVFFSMSLGGLQLYQWTALALVVAFGWLVSSSLGRWLALLLGVIAARTPARWDERLVGTIDRPLGLALWGVILAFTAKAVGLSPEAGDVVRRVWKLLFLSGLGWFLFRLLDVLGSQWRTSARERSAGSLSFVPIIQRAGKFMVALLVALAALDVIGVNVVAALAGVGLGGLALAFAAQKTLENVFGALAIAADRPFAVGDLVQIGEVLGTVEDVGLRSTRVRTVERTVVTIPNGTVVGERIVNYTERDRFLFTCAIGVVPDTTVDQMTFIIDEIRKLLRGDPRATADGQRVRFTGFGQSSLQIEVFTWIETTDFATYAAIAEDLNFKIVETVERSGSRLALPSQTLYLGRGQQIDSERADEVSREVSRRKERGELLALDQARGPGGPPRSGGSSGGNR